MPISSYLASTYLNPSDQPKKKRKTKHKSDQTQVQSLAITDDDVSLPALANASDDDSPVVVATNAARAAKKKTKANWTAVGSAAPTNAQAGLADQILQAAENERRQREEEEEAGERPAIVGDEQDYKTMLSSQKAQKQREAKADAEAEDEDEEDALASGAKAGLQTASQVREQMDRKRRAEKKRIAESGLDEGANSETVYRDASGRIISVADQKAAQRARDEEKAAAAKAQREALGGEVQASERAARREKLEDAKFMGVARYKDDKEMNDELKGVERWGDTMAGMVTKKKKSGKQYEGGFAPNRYGIRPGWRWDGVDRSNGFESKWFAARNKKKGMEQLEYEWQMDE